MGRRGGTALLAPLCLLVLVASLHLSYASVTKLTSQNFEEKTNQGAWFVKFFAVRCLVFRGCQCSVCFGGGRMDL